MVDIKSQIWKRHAHRFVHNLDVQPQPNNKRLGDAEDEAIWWALIALLQNVLDVLLTLKKKITSKTYYSVQEIFLLIIY